MSNYIWPRGLDVEIKLRIISIRSLSSMVFIRIIINSWYSRACHWRAGTRVTKLSVVLPPPHIYVCVVYSNTSVGESYNIRGMYIFCCCEAAKSCHPSCSLSLPASCLTTHHHGPVSVDANIYIYVHQIKSIKFHKVSNF